MELRYPEEPVVPVPWPALLTAIGGGALSLCAWMLCGVDLVLLGGITASAMLSCLAREPLPDLQTQSSARAGRSRRRRSLPTVRVAQPHPGPPAPAVLGSDAPAARPRPTR